MNIAYLFDFDGVLVDSLELHFLTMRDVCADYGLYISREEFLALVGRSGVDQIIHFAEKEQVELDAREVYARKNAHYQARLDEISCISSNCTLMSSLRRAGIPVAIASSSTRRVIMPLVEKFSLACDAIVSIDDVVSGKPDPALFEEAAARMGVAPTSCIVVEDSLAGVEAAHRAGMAVLHFLRP